jgi:hypothetical protein
MERFEEAEVRLIGGLSGGQGEPGLVARVLKTVPWGLDSLPAVGPGSWRQMSHQTKGWLEVRPWRPHVVAVACYLAVFSVFSIWTLCSLKLDQYADMVLTPRYFGLSLWQLLSVMNVAWLVLLGLDLVMDPGLAAGSDGPT